MPPRASMIVRMLSPIEPRWTGMWGALAISAPVRSNRAQEKSSRSLMLTDVAVLRSATPISSAIAANAATSVYMVPTHFAAMFDLGERVRRFDLRRWIKAQDAASVQDVEPRHALRRLIGSERLVDEAPRRAQGKVIAARACHLPGYVADRASRRPH